MNKKTSNSMAADIASAISEATKKWTKTRKAEERRPAMRMFRGQRMRRERRTEWADVMTPELMTEGYLQTSGNRRLPAEARQFMYSVRAGLCRRLQVRLFQSQYFTKTLLPKFMADNRELTARLGRRVRRTRTLQGTTHQLQLRAGHRGSERIPRQPA